MAQVHMGMCYIKTLILMDFAILIHAVNRSMKFEQRLTCRTDTHLITLCVVNSDRL